MTERARFDAWLDEYVLSHKTVFPPDALLACWQASRNAALEDAAKACEEVAKSRNVVEMATGANLCVDAIRAIANGDTN